MSSSCSFLTTSRLLFRPSPLLAYLPIGAGTARSHPFTYNLSTHCSECVTSTSLNLSSIPDVTQVTAAVAGLRDTAAVNDRNTLRVNDPKMRNAELKIITTDTPQLAQNVDAKRLESLTGYPLARLCEWAPARRKQPGLGPADGQGDDTQD